jgi:hypothetical protein
MALPTEMELIDGVLKAIHRIGRPASVDEQKAEVIRLLNISPEDVLEIHRGSRTKLSYNIAWARTALKNAGLLSRLDQGVWDLTDLGRKYSSIYDFRDSVGGSAFDELFDPEEDSEAVEGFDASPPEKYDEYPIDSVLIRQETRTVFEIVRRIKDNRFIMDPDFQRDFIWDPGKQSKLIESMVMRIPLPVFYLAEREDGKTVVVDGLQRLTTFLRFMDNSFPLKNLEFAKELNGKRYSDLLLKLQNRIEDTQLILYLIDSKVPEQAKLDIFDRVNGGVPLTRQQMRNSIYCGNATRWLKEQVTSEDFILATGRSLDRRTMRDRECVNRFCAFDLLKPASYTNGDMDAFLAQALKYMNKCSPEELQSLGDRFRMSMRNNYSVFGAHGFRKHRVDSTRRSVINVGLFDVLSVLLSHIPEEKVTVMAPQLRSIFFVLMDDAAFVDAISLGTNSTTRVKRRFEIAEAKFRDLMDAHNA